MGRVRREVAVAGRSFWALFDTGAMNTYVVEDVAALLLSFPVEPPEPVALGGRTHQIEKGCVLFCLVEGLPIRVQARVLPEIGTDERGKRIDVLVGALAMQEWSIVPVPREERLDMTHYPRAFVEFVQT
jgi:hypothetical protein